MSNRRRDSTTGADRGRLEDEKSRWFPDRFHPYWASTAATVGAFLFPPLAKRINQLKGNYLSL